MILWEVLVGVLLVRLVQVLRGGGRAPSEGFVLLWSLLVLVTGLAGTAVLGGALWCAPGFLAGLVLLLPWTVTRRVLIPLGMPRAAYRLGALAGWSWGRERRGGGLVAAAWAVLRQEQPDRDRVDWIEGVRDREAGFHASHALVTGLVAAARGDVAGARAMIESVDELGPNTSPRIVRALAREWLAAEAAGRGDWLRVRALGAGAGPRTRSTRLLGAVAGRVTRAPGAVSALALWLVWALAPGRRHSFALVRRAARVPVARQCGGGGVPETRCLGTSLRPDLHRDALVAHVALLRGQSGASRADALRGLAHAWDRALDDPGTREGLLRRAAALGARNGDDALAALTGTVASDLAAMAREHELPIASWSEGSRTLREAERLLRDQLIAEVELAFDALRDRVVGDRRLSAVDEWREWLSLRRLHGRAVALGGLELRRLVFPHVYAVVGKLAVWLWNERAQYLVANAMFRWLLSEAVAVGDAQAIELQRRNWDEAL